MPQQYNNRHYIIFDCTELGTIDFNQVIETSINTVRKSVDESQALVKYDYNIYLDENGVENFTIPASVEALTTKSQPYSYEEILTILSGPDWTDPNNEE